jgi:glutathione S-transferase
MKLYGRVTSFNVQKILWLLEELQLPYEHIELGGRFGGLDSTEFTQLNPMKKVPVLIDLNKTNESSYTKSASESTLNDLTLNNPQLNHPKIIWESHSILRYLIAMYGDAHWYPNCPYKRSQYERWLDWSQVTFQPAFMGTFWGYYRMPANNRNMKQVNNDLKQCLVCLQDIENQLSHARYLAGETISIADIVVGAVIYRLTSQGLPVSLPKYVNAWYQDLQRRKGYQQWIMSDFSELKARETY